MVTERIEDVNVIDEMESSYIDYAISVIHARALPDARDGLKPVQRRILFQMQEMSLTPDKPHVKSARVVGDVMGKLHPHGDSAIYDALVRLARPFAMSVPLVDGHGNFGSLDDGPAASRYTEARLTKAALLMTADLDEDVVDFVPNYDGSYQQPSVLPAAFPNLLINGTTGIAVGMATNMAPHNPGEALRAADYLLGHPKATLSELMRRIPGPDLPGGGIIVGLDGVKDAYATGRGTFTMRATSTIEQVGPRTRGIVVTELPYMVGPEQIIQKIKDGVQNRKLDGIRAVHDLTDRINGMKLVIEVKTGFDPKAVRLALFKHTPLETNFSINNVVLVDNQPQTLGLIELLRVYIDHRVSVTRRRSEFRLNRAKDRLHLVEGLLVAIVDIDEVIAVIRSSDTADIAKTRLQQVFDLSQVQAEYILELRLRRLTKLAQIDLESERDELLRTISELEEILGSTEALHAVVSAEFKQTLKSLNQPRRTVLLSEDGQQSMATKQAPKSLTLTDEPCSVAVTTQWRAVVTDPIETELPRPKVQLGEPMLTATTAAIETRFNATTTGECGVVTSDGTIHRLQLADLPKMPSASLQAQAGIDLAKYLGIAGDEIVGVVPLDQVLSIATSAGVIKRVQPDWPKSDAWPALNLKPKDEVVAARPCEDSAELVLITAQSQLLRFAASSVRPQGRSGGGIAGIKLAPGDRVIALGVVTDPSSTLIVTRTIADNAIADVDPGLIKVSPMDEFPAKGRATGGVRSHRFVNGYTQLYAAWVVSAPVVATAADGQVVPFTAIVDKRNGSGTIAGDVIATFGTGV